MSNWSRFLAKTQTAAEKVASKASALAAEASHAMKLKAMQSRIDEQYEKLGELVYRDLHVEESLEDEKLAVIAAIDALFDELLILKKKNGSAEAEEETAEAVSEETDGEE
ncbi:MAG: hypothetical protein IJC99_07365 [Clostridia bacterium]|nr:hypothetical protein [Clostridia bacterium]